MDIEIIDGRFCICKTEEPCSLSAPFCFTAVTDNENSVVCPEEFAPRDCAAREDGYRAFRIKGQLDFSLIGILAAVTEALRRAEIAVFAVSTYDTDYIFVKEERFAEACKLASRV